jgi:methylene-fatty-acyl-phospholipid synthase
LGWILLPHLEFKYKLLSKLCGGKQSIASDILAYSLVYFGAIRNYYFDKAMKSGIQVSYGIFEVPIVASSYVFMIIGLVLVFFSFYRLGLRGMYFGDHFGFLFENRITEFPYNYLENPQYVGTTIFFLAAAARRHSPVGVFITLLVNVFYRILNTVESRKLKVFYPQSNEINKKIK